MISVRKLDIDLSSPESLRIHMFRYKETVFRLPPQIWACSCTQTYDLEVFRNAVGSEIATKIQSGSFLMQFPALSDLASILLHLNCLLISLQRQL